MVSQQVRLYCTVDTCRIECCLPSLSGFYVLVFDFNYFLFGAKKILLNYCFQQFTNCYFDIFDLLGFIIDRFTTEPSYSKITYMDFTIDFIEHYCCQIYFGNYFGFIIFYFLILHQNQYTIFTHYFFSKHFKASSIYPN